jgi:hypothetical protein
MGTSEKTCFKCGSVKPLDEFYRHKAMADGHLNKCKECTKSDVHKHRELNIDKLRKYDLERAKDPARRKRARAVSAQWRAADNRRQQAHNKVHRAVQAGLIERKPCCVCGSEKSYAHHESYDRPLDVIFYCQPHHKERHKQMKIEGINP